MLGQTIFGPKKNFVENFFGWLNFLVEIFVDEKFVLLNIFLSN